MPADRGGEGCHPIKPVFQKFNKRIADYSKQTREAPYVYREETLTSLLCAAGWACKMPSVMEFHVDRTIAGKTTNGFADLSIWNPDGPHKYFCEAKAVFFVLHASGPSLTREILAKLEAALCQTASLVDLHARDGNFKCAVLYFIPNILNSKAQARPELMTCKPAIDLVKKLKPGLLSWCFPAFKKKDMPTHPSGGYFRSGVLAAVFDESREEPHDVL